MRGAALVAVLLLAPVRAGADVVPFGWQPPPPSDEGHVAALRASLAEWMNAEERARLDAQRPAGCARVPALGRGAGYGGAPCPNGDRVREVAIDRAVRFFGAETLDALGSAAEARALRELRPMRDEDDRREAARRLAGRAELAPARRLASDGMRWSLEQVATELGRAIRAAHDAGAPRERLVGAALAMLGALGRPTPRHTARAEISGGDAADRRFAALVARQVLRCLEGEAEARWRPVAIRVSFVGGPQRQVRVAPAPRELRACLEEAVTEATRRSPTPPPTHPIAARIIVGPAGPLWGEPLELR